MATEKIVSYSCSSSSVGSGTDMTKSMDFFGVCKARNPALLDSILEHELFVDIADDTLDMSIFKTYIQGYNSYLNNLIIVVDKAAANSDDAQFKKLMGKCANLNRVNDLILSYFEEFSFEPLDKPYFGIEKYVSSLLTVAGEESSSVAFAALFPSFYIRHHVGNKMLEIAGNRIEANRFKRLIQGFNENPNVAGLLRASRTVKTYWNRADDQTKEKMVNAFQASVQGELNFINSIVKTLEGMVFYNVKHFAKKF